MDCRVLLLWLSTNWIHGKNVQFEFHASLNCVKHFRKFRPDGHEPVN
ncbi:hypothetical protein TcasGA2_TC033090 [Tribolium castaneum]|uniref:Uncharacterized protein n=1 Tax=Tribolium castaneum TaxID=7070 RepID=A0A139WIE5_TRICA|nr:hypothetical protein TcasGA2_TC033090 [Tribolium castaneum]